MASDIIRESWAGSGKRFISMRAFSGVGSRGARDQVCHRSYTNTRTQPARGVAPSAGGTQSWQRHPSLSGAARDGPNFGTQ